MDDEEDEHEKWTKEREKVLDEWSEIELKGREALTADVTHEPGSSEGLVASEATLEELYPLLELQKPVEAISALDKIIQICLCRPSRTQMPPLGYTHKSLLLKLSHVPYDDNNGTHWLLLSDYFKIISQIALDTPNTPCPRVGSHWQIVGFQGNNPATDFRGCGILALLQLHSFTQKLPHNILQSIVQLSRTEPNDFPLAVVSINMTGLILAKLKKDSLDQLANPLNGLYSTISSLHAACLAQFCGKYKSQNASLAACQTIINDIDALLEKSPTSLLRLLEPNNDVLIKQLL
ncbi:unnamed protein product [Caenorhabditis bovis]|uniref:ELMO domain-containing protein n=1 Tax=Caenorhabditis bovis TaxID=2654633 RepID=A0A8S1EHC0_9PELO|nr:unnamed protein product [Caenorhabditis bovis]